jgi:glycosyltransferase involved in cell wall biosynthesis
MTIILHLLSQRPSLTGSGITLDGFVRHAAEKGWDQHVSVGVPASDRSPAVGNLPASRIHPLYFGQGALDFPVPGMSDVMPYTSTRFSSMSPESLVTYKSAWRSHLEDLISRFKPDLIHSHHVWIMSALIKDVAPTIPVVNQCHATGLRQMELCPHLAEEVRKGCARNDHFVVLHNDHARALREKLGLPAERIHMVGAGYRADLFNLEGAAEERANQLLYTGKYSRAKGVPWLLDAVEKLSLTHPDLRLHVAGTGAGEEGEAIKKRMESMAPCVVIHGMLTQAKLADLMRRCAVCVLPSFYEGVPLVLVEAMACGCRLVSTNLPGVMDQLAPSLGESLDLVDLPRLKSVDEPLEDDLPAFVENLCDTLQQATSKAESEPPAKNLQAVLEPFTWQAVFQRVEKVWSKALNT